MCRRECEMRMKVFSCVIGLILLIERERVEIRKRYRLEWEKRMREFVEIVFLSFSVV
jgi:hypothetical protein